MDPWEGAGRRPECPRCEQASAMYLWDLQAECWYCSTCLKIWAMPEGIEIGGQAAMFAPDRPEDGA